MEPVDGPGGGGAAAFAADLPLDGETCDGCRADDGDLARVTLRSGGQLVLCGACWTVHGPALREQAATVRG